MSICAPHLRCARRGAVGLVLTPPLPPLPCHAVCIDGWGAAAQALLRRPGGMADDASRVASRGAGATGLPCLHAAPDVRLGEGG